MRAVIVSGGSIKDYEYIRSFIRDGDAVICADSGYDHAVRMGLNVTAVVGDMDSITSLPGNIKVDVHPSRKDETDTEIALTYARGLGCDEFLFIAATGTRLDHSLSNIMLLKECLDKNEPAELIDEHNRVFMINSGILLDVAAGTTVSLVPLTECRGVTTSELEYPLENATLYMEKARGVSNVAICEHVSVKISSGFMLVIIARD